MPLEPSVAQIAPFRVRCLDQRDLLFAAPIFQLLFSCNRLHYGIVTLEVDKVGHVVFGRESTEEMHLVLKDALFQIACDSDVEYSALAAQDVNVVGFIAMTHVPHVEAVKARSLVHTSHFFSVENSVIPKAHAGACQRDRTMPMYRQRRGRDLPWYYRLFGSSRPLHRRPTPTYGSSPIRLRRIASEWHHLSAKANEWKSSDYNLRLKARKHSSRESL
jgi:hypothetical protein